MTRKIPSPPEFGGGKKALALLIGKLCGIAAVSNVSFAGPAGGVVTAGDGAISTPTSTSTVIDQNSNRLSVDWQSFDVASNESVRFNQPTSNSVALNRILDQKPSEIFGRIDANGRVVLFNANGMVFGPGSQINAASLLATSLNVVSFDEATGRLRLAATGNPGSIINSGTITSAPGGSVSLVGGMVSNNGLIVADLGSVNLGAGRSATLDFYGGGLLRFDANSELVENGSGASAGVSNSGTISADGGQVLLTTSAVKNVFERAVNNDGLIRANRIDNSGGTIRLVGAGGTVVNSGVLDASGVGVGSTGGSVQVLGENVGLFGNARVDVSGDAGGGVALIGGDYQGANPDVLNAVKTIVAPRAQIVADARVSGDGGRVILWSDEVTNFYGGISARGGAQSGNGGFAEVSSHGSLQFDGVVKVGAPSGNGGQLLLDPANIEIVATGGTDDPPLDFTTVTTADPALVNASAIVNALDPGTLVFLRATDSILVSAAVDATTRPAASGGDLELSAGNNVTLNAGITTLNGDISITADAGDLTFLNSGITLNAGTANITLDTNGNLALGRVLGGALDLTAGQSISQLAQPAPPPTIAVSRLAGNGLTISAGTSINLGTAGEMAITGTMTGDAGTAATIVNTGTLAVNNFGTGDGLNISTTGNLNLGMVTAGDAATFTSTTGAIIDTNQATAVAAPEIHLVAFDRIGDVTLQDLIDGALGTPLNVNITDAAGGILTASVSALNGQINLDLQGTPSVPGSGISVGGGAASSGTVLLQTAGAFDLTAAVLPLANDAIDLGAANTAAVGFRSRTGVLTLPANVETLLFSNAPGTLSVQGTNIVDNDGAGLAFTVGRLIYRTNTASSLTTNINRLTAFTNNQLLQVTENDDIVLDTVNVGTGTLRLDVNGAITDGATTPSVIANRLEITDASLVALDTNVNTLNAIGIDGVGGLTIAEASGLLTVEDATVTGGGAVNISTVTGPLTVTNASGTGVTLASSGAGGVLTATTVNAGTGAASLTSNGNMSLGTVSATGAGGVTLTANGGGAITSTATLPAVAITAPQLTINAAGSVTLNTNVTTLSASGINGAGGLTIAEQTGPLTVNNAVVTGGGAVNISTVAGALSVTNASGAGVTLAANGAGGTLSATTVNAGAGTASLTSNGNMTLGTVSATGAGGVTLTANGGGAITSTATLPAVAITAPLLTINAAGSATLNTNVNSLTATGINGAGGLTIAEQSGPLTVNDATVTGGGAVNISTVTGALTVTNASGTGVTLSSNGTGGVLTATTVNAGTGAASLTSNGNMTLGTVNSTSASGVTLVANGGGQITDGAGVSVTAPQLTITAGSLVNLDTNVTQLTATGIGAGGITLVEQSGPLTVTNANAVGGAVNISTLAGNLNVTNATGAGVTLNAGSSGVSGDTVASGNLAVTGTVLITGGATTANLTADGAISLGTVNAGTRAVTLTARDGAITDVQPSITPSVVAGTLTINDADSVDLDTNITTLNASGVSTTLTIRDQVGDLAVTNASTTGATGAVDVRANDGSMTVTNAAANNGVALRALGVGGTLSATTVDAGAGLAVLASNGNMMVTTATGTGITATAGGTGSLTAGTLNAGAGLLTASTNDGNLSVTNATGNGVTLAAGNADTLGSSNINVATVNAGTGTATLTAGGSILDDDDGTANTTRITGATVSLTARDAIGTVTDFTTAAGSSIDVLVNAPGTLTANVSSNTGGSINLNISGNPVINTGGITLGTDPTDRAGNVLLQSASALDLQGLTAGAINIGVDNDVGVGFVSGGVLTLPTSGFPTDQPAASLLLRGTDIVRGPTALRNFIISADELVFDASGPTGNFDLETSVNTLTSHINGFDLNVDEKDGNITLGEISARRIDIKADAAGGEIRDDGDENTHLTATQTVSLGSVGFIGATTANAGIDVDTPDLAVFSGTGDAVIRSVGASPISVAITAGNAAPGAAGNGNISLAAAGDIAVAALVAGGDVVNVSSTGGQIVSAAAVPVVTANQLTITDATNVNLGTNIDSLTATGVDGSLTIAETAIGGALTVVDADAAGPINVSTTNGALSVARARSDGAVTLAAGGAGSNLTVVTATGTNATLTSGGALTVTTSVNAAGGTANLSAAGPMTLGTVTANTASLTTTGGASNGITLGTINAASTTLDSTGAITDGPTSTASVVGTQLTIARGLSASLDTDVTNLSASVTDTLNIREQTGPLTVSNATSAIGSATIATAGGALNVTNAVSASGNVTLTAGGAASDLTVGTAGTPATVTAGGTATLTADRAMNLANGTVNSNVATLTSNGDMTLGRVNANPTAGSVTLQAGTGAITDNTASSTPSVQARTLTIGSASSANLDTDVNELVATTAGALSIRELSSLTVTNATAGNAINIATANGALTVTNAVSTTGSLTLAAGGTGGNLDVATATGTGATLTSSGSMTVANNTLNARTGAATLTSGTTMSLGTVNAASATLNSGGAMTLGTVSVGTGAASLTSGGAMTLGTVNAGSATLTTNGAGNGITLGSVNTGTGTTTLAAGGAITDAPGAAASVTAGQLTITRAASVDLDTNVNTLDASTVSGALSIREQSGALAVTNASATGAVNVSAVGGALTVTNATSTGGLVSLAANGAGNTLDVTTASGVGATLNAGGNIVFNSVNANTGAASLTAGGTINDRATGTGLSGATATLGATSIGTAANTLNTSVNSLSATASTGGIFVREANDVTLGTVTASASGQDVVVGTTGNITVNRVTSAGGRVLLAAGDNIVASNDNGPHITAQSVELRAGLNVAQGGGVGTATRHLVVNAPVTVGGGNGTQVPSILLIQNESPADSSVAALGEQLDTDPGVFEISSTTFDPNPSLISTDQFLTTTFSTRTLAENNKVDVANAIFNAGGALDTSGENRLTSTGAEAVLTGSEASNSQGEGTLYIDWASFDPNVSLFGTVNPPICLPRDQSDEEAETVEPAAAAAAPSTSGGCAPTTAQRDNSTIPPQAKLVISSRGWEWVSVSGARRPSDPPLIGQLR